MYKSDHWDSSAIYFNIHRISRDESEVFRDGVDFRSRFIYRGGRPHSLGLDLRDHPGLSPHVRLLSPVPFTEVSYIYVELLTECVHMLIRFVKTG